MSYHPLRASIPFACLFFVLTSTQTKAEDVSLSLAQAEADEVPLGTTSPADTIMSSPNADNVPVEPAMKVEADTAQVDPDAPETHVSLQRSTQTDHLDVETAGFEQDFKFNQGRGILGPAFQYSRFDQKNFGNANLYRPDLAGSYKINDWASLTGVAGVDEIEASSARERVIPTYNAYATLWPDKTVRLNLGSNRATMGNIPSLRQGITGTYFGGDVSYLPSDGFRLTGRGNEGLYTDGNERQFGQVEAEQRILQEPAAVFLGTRFTGMHYQHTLSNGYFDPLRYGAAEGTLRFHADLTHKWSLEAGGSAGVEVASPSNVPKVTYSPNAKLSYAISKKLTLDGTAEYYKSKLASDSGFSQLVLGAGLHYAWQ